MLLIFSLRKLKSLCHSQLFCLTMISACALFTWKTLRSKKYHFSNFEKVETPLNCKGVLNRDQEAIDEALLWNDTLKIQAFDSAIEDTLVASDQCATLKEHFNFNSAPSSADEKEYPLAFVLTVHNSPRELVELLQAIYWPQNIYCITYDEKSMNLTKEITHMLAKCFHNVVLPHKFETVKWGDITVLLAALNCLRKLAESPVKWKYVQIVDYKDYPLKTNYEMVQIYKILNGSNDMELNIGGKDRHVKLPPPPHNMTIYKGSFAPSMTADFVDFILNSEPAHDLLRWLNNTYIPDEHYFSTLNFNTHIGYPKAYPGTCWSWPTRAMYMKNWISRYQLWVEEGCLGKMMRGSCVFGVRDLPNLISQPHLFVHKFHPRYTEPAGIECMKQWFAEKQKEVQKPQEDSTYDFYRNLAFVRYFAGNGTGC